MADQQSSECLVRGRFLIRGIDAAGAPEIIEDGCFVARDGVIAEIGSYEEIRRRNSHVRVLGSPHDLVCPGFVNAHHHVGLTPFQLGTPDLPLELWILRRIASRSVDPYLDTLYSAFEMIASGVTTVQHLHGRASRPVARIVDTASEVVRAYEDVGMRASYSYGLRDQNRIVYGSDGDLIRDMPADIADDMVAFLAEQTLSIDESLAVFHELRRRYQGSGRIRIQLAPVNLQWCSDEAIGRTVEAARDACVPIHMHLLETSRQRDYARMRTGDSAVSHLHRLGVLGPDMTLGHGIWVTQADMEMIGGTGTCVCHNCSSNLRLRSGTAPIDGYRRHGVTLAIGIDEAGINDDRDMLQEMRMVLRMNHRCDQPDSITAAEVFRMATAGGAATTGFGAAIGRLEVGRAADAVILEWEKIAAPYLSPDIGVLDALVQRGRAAAVRTVIVDGEPILDQGRFTRVDAEAVRAELSRRMAQPLTQIEERNQHLGQFLLEYGRHFYNSDR